MLHALPISLLTTYKFSVDYTLYQFFLFRAVSSCYVKSLSNLKYLFYSADIFDHIHMEFNAIDRRQMNK
jgi:hypothetical protein